jgi:hypothetical protein
MNRLIGALLVASLVLAGCGSEPKAPSPPPDCLLHPQAAPAALPSEPAPKAPGSGTAPSAYHPKASPRSGIVDAIGGGHTTYRSAGARVVIPQGPGLLTDSPVDIVLPSTLYLIAGETYRLVYANFVSGFDSAKDVAVIQPLTGSSDHGDYWEYTPPEVGTFTLSISIKSRAGTTLSSASRPISVLTTPEGDRLRQLSVGDSITRAGGYAQIAAECVLGGTAIGTRTYDSGRVSEEGRGGWTLANYMTRIAQPTGGDSPFLFPTGVDGKKYLGNTSFWRDVTVGNPHGYDFDGFQMMARGWQTSGPYRFDVNGYPSSPTVGDVVVDPTLDDGTKWREFDGAAWLPMEPQPQVEVSFSKYIDRFAAAFAAGPPTAVTIMLGTVDFLSSLTDAKWSAYKVHLDALIASIRKWNTEIPIIVIGSPSGGPDSLWADQKVKGSDFNKRIIDHNRRLYNAYDTAEERSNRVYVTSFLGVVSPDNMADYVHPKMPQGHSQMGVWLAGMLAHLISEGEI